MNDGASIKFEVERKFLIPSCVQQEQFGTYISRQVLRDVYFDTACYSLTGRSFWLRCRQNVFELKIRVGSGDFKTDRYEELKGTVISERLFGQQETISEEALSQREIRPFAQIMTERTSYCYDDCELCLDIADFGDFRYQVAEIECGVDREEDLLEAEQRVLEVAHRLNFDVQSRVEGKLIAYLREQRPEHYAYLVTCGAVQI